MSRALRYLRRRPLSISLALLLIALLLYRPSMAVEIPRVVDLDSLSLIISLLILVRGLELSGALGYASISVARAGRGCIRRIAILLALSTAALSMVVMNDTALFVFVPIATAIALRMGVEVEKIAALIAIAANVGSMASPIGNPQNIYIWRHFGVSVPVFLEAMGIAAVALLLLLVVYSLALIPRICIEIPSPPIAKIDRVLAVGSGTAIALDLSVPHVLGPLTPLAIALLVPLVLRRTSVFRAIDLELIAIFILMFIDFGLLSHTLRGCIPHANTFLLGIALSQIVSNVPTTILLAPYTSSWIHLAYAVNIGGIPTVVSSMANLIALRLSSSRASRFHLYTSIFFVLSLPIVALLLELWKH